MKAITRSNVRRAKHTTWVAAIILGLAALVPAPTYAGIPVSCLNCVMPPMLMQQTTSIVQAINQNTQRVTQKVQRNTQKVTDSVDTAASNIVSELDAHLAGMGKLTNALENTIVNALKEHRATQAAMKADYTFGSASKSYTVDGVVHQPTGQPKTLCKSSARSYSVGHSVASQEQVVASTTVDIEDYNNSFDDPSGAIERYAGMDEKAFEGDLVVGDGDALKPDEKKNAKEWIKTVTNPLPNPKLADKAKKTGAGHSYLRMRQRYQARMGVPQNVMVDLMGDTVMTVPLANTVENRWQEIDPSKTIESHDGKVSPMQVIRSEVMYRYASKEWTDRLADFNNHAALIELLQMKAIGLKIAYERYQLERARTTMMAMTTAQDIRQTMGPELDAKRKHAKAGL